MLKLLYSSEIRPCLFKEISAGIVFTLPTDYHSIHYIKINPNKALQLSSHTVLRFNQNEKVYMAHQQIFDEYWKDEL